MDDQFSSPMRLWQLPCHPVNHLDTYAAAFQRPTGKDGMFLTCVGHAGDIVGDTWFIAGGGNNTSGCTDTVALDLSPLATSDQEDEPLTWSTVSQAEPRSDIVSEGLIVEAIPYARCLLSFGGYNGRYQSTLQIFKPGDMHSGSHAPSYLPVLPAAVLLHLQPSTTFPEHPASSSAKKCCSPILALNCNYIDNNKVLLSCCCVFALLPVSW